MVRQRHIQPLVLLVSRCGFTKETYFLINVGRWVACKRKSLPSQRLRHVSAKLASGVVVIVVVANAASVARVRKESGYRVETVAPVGSGHRVHKESVRPVHKGSGESVRPVSRESVPRGSKARLGSVRPVRHVHHVHKGSGESVRPVSRESVPSVYRALNCVPLPLLVRPARLDSGYLSRRRQQHRSYRMLLQNPPRHHQLRLELVRVRANRGDSKPCYWHRHVQSIVDSIAVA
jgi:hypothetical protein